ncbi:putative CEN-like protein 2 [Iris pallida]|uniref:CEN-like protein 2 n=1 Tax=Iris pallida TaxID=29817 RepID=A0AAX6EXE2_IRIPA|nr:putative CEN-like protein 2 [Iris pallida]
MARGPGLRSKSAGRSRLELFDVLLGLFSRLNQTIIVPDQDRVNDPIDIHDTSSVRCNRKRTGWVREADARHWHPQMMCSSSSSSPTASQG